MAFMMPVVKNDYDIYKSGRMRRKSECSSGSGIGSGSGHTPSRSRKVSECTSRSLGTSPASVEFLASRKSQMSTSAVSRQNSSRADSRDSLQSPSKSISNSSSSPPKCNSQSSLNKFHMRLVDRLKRSLNCNDPGESRRAS